MVEVDGMDVDVDIQSPEDIDIDLCIDGNEPEEEHNAVSNNVSKRERKQKGDASVDKKELIIKTLIRIAKHLDYIKKNTFQRDISERIDIIGEELNFLTDILGVKKCEG